MGLPTGWVTDASGLSQNQQITALGNGVLPLQAVSALSLLAA
ncbi:DNA (cytosine-5)-methyltransferase 1 [Knoellia remsis]|jgi:DNA (cytosine-5)-methyltransferase 1|uniref:DNA (Cytosine-5)-methyltransferase 1 n=2 Tax=Knoellia remsis TaxID=407159 RepID=A0A2T0TXL6_9MICO|nr:DNA (cytosine-5)-methyltransferase 1 [Knoellia remsis]